MGSKDRVIELRVDCAGFLKDRQSHGGTVESSSACSVHHPIYVFILLQSHRKTGKLVIFFSLHIAMYSLN